MKGTKRYSIGAAIADFYVISIILGALAGFYVAATNRPIPIWALSLNIGLALTLSIVYHSVWARNVVFRTVGEVMMGRVVVDGRKHWTNPYGINRTLLFVVLFIALVYAPNYWQWAADERFYTELTFPVVLGSVVFFGCFLVGLVMVGRAQSAGAFLVVAFITLQAIGSLLDETPGVPTNIDRGIGLCGLFAAPVAGVVLFRYYRSAAKLHAEVPAGGTIMPDKKLDVPGLVASYQRLVFWFGVQLTIFVVGTVAMWSIGESNFPVPITLARTLGTLATIVALVLYAYRTASAIGSKVATIWAVAMLVPLLNVITLLVLSSKATRACRSHGIQVGFLGPKHVMPAPEPGRGVSG